MYRFKGNLPIFFMFIAGNFVPFQILMVPVRDLTMEPGPCMTPRLGLVILFHVAFQDRVSARCSCVTLSGRCRSQLIEAARVSKASQNGSIFLVCCSTVDEARIGGTWPC